MVFRQLQLVLALLVGSACGNGGASTSTSIEMTVDEATCSTDVGGLRLNCESTAVVVVDDLSGDRLAESCATLPVGALVNSAQVIQDTLALGSLPSDRALTIRLSIFSGRLSPCPNTENSPPLLSGNTPIVVLAEATDSIPLVLRCDSIAEPGFPPDLGSCVECDSGRENCIFSGGVATCEDAAADCQENCPPDGQGEECVNSCNLLQSFCGDSDGQFVCNQDDGQCFQLCELDEANCELLCGNAAQLCSDYAGIRQSCELEHETCSSGCGDQNSCLSLSF